MASWRPLGSILEALGFDFGRFGVLCWRIWGVLRTHPPGKNTCSSRGFFLVPELDFGGFVATRWPARAENLPEGGGSGGPLGGYNPPPTEGVQGVLDTLP